MKKLLLLLQALWLAVACADTNSRSRPGHEFLIEKAAYCATCGAPMRESYFYGSNLQAIGPGSY